MNYNHYEEVAKLSEELRNENLDNAADTITHCIEAGATGTEIFMALRWNIGKILKSNKLSKNAKLRAQRLYDELEKSLE